MKIRSNAFGNNQKIPKKYTCDGNLSEGEINPPLEISGVPEGTVSLALIVHDPDAPVPGGWTHWIIFNINPTVLKIEEKSFPTGAIEGTTSSGKPGYNSPCPPIGVHHYQFKLLALDIKLDLNESAKKSDVEQAMQGHILEEQMLVGLYER